jgi:hypothetical protein
LVEFKVSPWWISDDVSRTAPLLALATPKFPHVFSYVVAAGEMFPDPRAV